MRLLCRYSILSSRHHLSRYSIFSISCWWRDNSSSVDISSSLCSARFLTSCSVILTIVFDEICQTVRLYNYFEFKRSETSVLINWLWRFLFILAVWICRKDYRIKIGTTNTRLRPLLKMAEDLSWPLAGLTIEVQEAESFMVWYRYVTDTVNCRICSIHQKLGGTNCKKVVWKLLLRYKAVEKFVAVMKKR